MVKVTVSTDIYKVPYLKRVFNTRLKNCRLLFSAVISEHFSKNRVIISVVAAKIWYLKKCAVFIGLPCIYRVAQKIWHHFSVPLNFTKY